MALQKGKDLLLRLADGETYVTIAGLRARQIAFGATPIDATDADSPGQWRELLSGASEKRASISGAGLFRDSAADAMMRAAFFNGEAMAMQIVIPDFGALTGTFQIVDLSYSGRHDEALSFEIKLESAGVIVFGEL